MAEYPFGQVGGAGLKTVPQGSNVGDLVGDSVGDLVGEPVGNMVGEPVGDLACLGDFVLLRLLLLRPDPPASLS